MKLSGKFQKYEIYEIIIIKKILKKWQKLNKTEYLTEYEINNFDKNKLKIIFHIFKNDKFKYMKNNSFTIFSDINKSLNSTERLLHIHSNVLINYPNINIFKFIRKFIYFYNGNFLISCKKTCNNNLLDLLIKSNLLFLGIKNHPNSDVCYKLKKYDHIRNILYIKNNTMDLSYTNYWDFLKINIDKISFFFL